MSFIIRKIKLPVIFLIACVIAVSCQQPVSEHPGNQPSYSIQDISEVATKLPEAPGYQAFNNNCLICHSSRYILNQPDFPEKTWASIVTKMQKTFGAPVPDSSIHEIVQYLVAIKGIN
ncbi:MAG: hypothetical protein H3C48_11395 [Chitinophagaceae bacterium]|nr:hypothetical protein [Chitinophagaceae bacterium]